MECYTYNSNNLQKYILSLQVSLGKPWTVHSSIVTFGMQNFVSSLSIVEL